jgi:FtsH-binding integral membrane protein
MEMKDVWNRTDADPKEIILSPHLYNLAIGLVLIFGFSLNYWMVLNIEPQWIMRFGFWPFIIGYFVSCFAGVMLFTMSNKPIISFVGYNLVVVPFGFVVNIVVSGYNPEIVIEAIKVTGLVTAGMMVLGTLFPKFFERIAGALFAALFLVIIVELVDIFFLGGGNKGWIDWVVVIIFCGYIGYDWGRANRLPKTLDNAIDCAAALYMDIINLFLRILRIMSRK